MNAIKVLIIEDLPAESEPLVTALQTNGYEVVGTARTFAEALSLFYTTQPDVLIIDVFLDGKPEGIVFAETLNITPGISKPFVFLTSSKDRQIFERAKLTQPFSFLLKPFNELEILYAIEMAVEKFYNAPMSLSGNEQNTIIIQNSIFIKKKDALKKIAISDILYIEVEGRYCNVVTEKEKFLIMISLLKINELLDDKCFKKTHRNYIVNINQVEQIILNENLIILKGNHKITLGDTYKGFLNDITILK